MKLNYIFHARLFDQSLKTFHAGRCLSQSLVEPSFVTEILPDYLKVVGPKLRQLENVPLFLFWLAMNMVKPRLSFLGASG